MKKITFILSFLLYINISYAQVSIGLRSGINFSKENYPANYVYESLEDFSKFRPLFSLALPLKVNFSNDFGIQLEPSFIQKGGNNNFFYPRPGEAPTHKVSINTWSFPLLITYDLFHKNNLKLGLLGGTAIVYERYAKVVKAKGSDFEQKLNQTNFEAIIGTDCRIRLKQYSIIMDVRYTHGLTQRGRKWSFEESYHNGINVSIGGSYTFEIK